MGHSAENEGAGPGVIDGELVLSVERWVLLSALGLSALAAVLWRSPESVGAVAAGGLVAFINLLALRRTVSGILGGTTGKQIALSVALFFKMGALLAAIWVAVRLFGFDPVGVGLGVSALVVGILGGTVFSLPQRAGRAQPGR